MDHSFFEPYGNSPEFRLFIAYVNSMPSVPAKHRGSSITGGLSVFMYFYRNTGRAGGFRYCAFPIEGSRVRQGNTTVTSRVRKGARLYLHLLGFRLLKRGVLRNED